MINIILTLLVGVCLGQEFECPIDPDDTNTPPNCLEDLYPYAYDCTKFWTCTLACQASLRDCPEGLEFNAATKTCESPADSNCVESTTGQPTTTTTTTTTVTTPTTTTTSITDVSSTVSVATTSGPLVNPTIFFVGRSSSYTGATNTPIILNTEEVDRLNDWINDDEFLVPTTGFYFINLNAGFMTGEPANFVLEGDMTNDMSVRHTTTSNNAVDMSSRDLILNLTEGSSLYVNQETSSGELYSSSLLETSLSVFSLHNSMDSLSCFSVARNVDYSTPGVIDFPRTIASFGTDWDGSNNRYVAPESGTYFFTFSAGVHETSTARLQLTVDGVVQAELRRDHTNNNNDFTFARTLVINLSAGQAVQVNLVEGDLQAASRNHISFSGFLYKPKYTPKVAWSLHKTSSWGGASRLYPVDYEDVLVNEGGAYNPTSHVVTIPYSGFYYLHLGAGAVNGEQVNLVLDVNGADQIRLRRLSTNHNGLDTLSRGGIYYLNTNDEIRIDCPAGYEFHGANNNNLRLTSFQGILIYSNY